MSNYDKAAETARRLVAKFGQAVVIVRPTRAPYNPVDPEDFTVGIELSTTGVCVVLPTSTSTIVDYDDMSKHDPEWVRANRLLYIAGKGLDFVLENGDIVRTAEGDVRLIGLTKLCPDGAIQILYRAKGTKDTSLPAPTDSETLPLYCNNEVIFCNNETIFCNAETYTT